MADIPKGKIRLIGLDLDDTVLNSQKEITLRVRTAIEAAIAKGIEVLPATGRAHSALPAEFTDIPGVRYAVCANGAVVYDLVKDEVIYEDCFTRENALKVLSICKESGMLASIFVGEKVYAEEDVDYDALVGIYDDVLLNYFRESRTHIPSLQTLLEETEEAIQKFTVIFYDPAIRADARQQFLDSGLCAVTSSLPDNLELNTTNCHKGTALLGLGRQLGIAHNEVMAVGDSTNDLEMLRAVGWAVAMGNGHKLVLQAADTITATADEDGVALAIEAVLPD